jgi:uncharacterized membrane protein
MATISEVRKTKTISNRIIWISAPLYVLIGYGVLGLLILSTGNNPFRVILATILAFVGSGYSLVAVLFRDRELDGVERLALSICLSQAVGGILGFILAESPWGLRLWPLLVAIGLFNLGCYLIITWQRRNREFYALPSRVNLSPIFSWWKDQTIFQKVVTTMLILMLLSGAWSFYQSLLMPKLDPPMTEFYITDSHGLVEEYPVAAKAGDKLSLYYGTVNRENETSAYQVEVDIDNQSAGKTNPFQLHPGESRQGLMEVQLPEDLSGLSRVDLTLYKGGKPYRFLHLWIDVEY